MPRGRITEKEVKLLGVWSSSSTNLAKNQNPLTIMKKGNIVLLVGVAALIGCALFGCESNETNQSSATQEGTNSVSPRVVFQKSFGSVKFRVYKCNPCTSAGAEASAKVIAESGKVTAHAFFSPSFDFEGLEEKVLAASSFVEAEAIVKAENPEQFKRIMATGVVLDY